MTAKKFTFDELIEALRAIEIDINKTRETTTPYLSLEAAQILTHECNHLIHWLKKGDPDFFKSALFGREFNGGFAGRFPDAFDFLCDALLTKLGINTVDELLPSLVK